MRHAMRTLKGFIDKESGLYAWPETPPHKPLL